MEGLQMEEMYRLANELTKEWDREKFNKIFRLGTELDIFVAEMDNGICIEDDVFYYEWQQLRSDGVSKIREETKEMELNYIKELHKDMVEHGKHLYTCSYDFENEDRVKITVERICQ